MVAVLLVACLAWLVGWLAHLLPPPNYQLPTTNWRPPSSSSVVAEKHKILWIRISCEAHQSAIRPKASQGKKSKFDLKINN